MVFVEVGHLVAVKREGENGLWNKVWVLFDLAGESVRDSWVQSVI